MRSVPILCINANITLDTILKFDTNTDANVNIDAQYERATSIYANTNLLWWRLL